MSIPVKKFDFSVDEGPHKTGTDAIRPKIADDSHSTVEATSPVRDLHLTLEKAFSGRERVRSEVQRGPFLLAMFGMGAVSALFWGGVAAIILAL